MSRTLLVTLTGRDRPGVTSRLFTELARFPLVVLDTEQIVLRGRLILGVLVDLAGADAAVELALRDGLSQAARELGLEIEVTVGTDDDGVSTPGPLHVTVLGHPLLPSAMAGVAGCIASCGANIDRIVRLASEPVTCIEMDVSGADPDVLRAELNAQAARLQVDVAVQRSGLYRRAKRLVVMDVDSTLVRGEVIEMLAERAGCAAQVAAITQAAMRGELDFEQSLRERVALLEGLHASTLTEVRESLVLTPGARTLVRTLKRLGYLVAIVSGGFTQITDGLVDELGLDFAAANTLEVVDGVLTGKLVGPIIDRPGKAAALERFAAAAGVPLTQTIAIGDGANDLDMLVRAGLGVAFNAKPVVREAADTALNVPYLDAILYLLGISRDEINAADAEGPAFVAT
ncbi:MAG TPA: phosphoserine phosphatase SerB [Acidothermaceae bacterium]|jgi:phosphoserine phosphatase|nr:phosphoserine phosphatase SerB [Acidothermaceae bacterium]